MENRKQFKPFDKVLVKYGKVWVADFYRNYVESTNIHLTLTGTSYDNDILPYEGNENLVGTTDEPEEEIKLEEGEWVMVCDEIKEDPWDWLLRYFLETDNNNICIQSVRFAYPDPCPYPYAIPFSDFNPNDMEETRKHILCVKDGKIVKYKG